jgi:hypothetical protein
MAWGGRRWRLVAGCVAFFVLVEQGVGCWEAARRVGVDYRLIKRWCAAPPVVEPVWEREFCRAAQPGRTGPDRRFAVRGRVAGDRSVVGSCGVHGQPGVGAQPAVGPTLSVSRSAGDGRGRVCSTEGGHDRRRPRGHGSAIGTLVERATRFVTLLHLSNGYGPAAVRDALATKIQTLPDQLRRSLKLLPAVVEAALTSVKR